MKDNCFTELCCYLSNLNMNQPFSSFSSVQSLSCVRLCDTFNCSTPGLTVHHQLPDKLMSIESVMPSNHLMLCPPLLLLPSIFPSIGVFSNESSSHQVAKVLELQLQDQSFQWIFRVDLLQDWLVWSFCNSRDSQESSPTAQFESINSLASDFMVQLSHPYIATGKNIALTIQTFVDKVMSLTFNMLSRYSFSSKEKISFYFMAAVTICRDFGAQENRVCHCFLCFPTYLPWNDGTECHDLHFLNVGF